MAIRLRATIWVDRLQALSKTSRIACYPYTVISLKLYRCSNNAKILKLLKSVVSKIVQSSRHIRNL